MLLFISGISTSGKSTIGKLFVETRQNWLFKDLDDFYISEKPMVKLSNGKIKQNWDCYEALDINALQKYLEEHKNYNICLVGFALDVKILGYKPDVHVHLVLDKDKTTLTNMVISNRQKSKGFTGAKADDDILMVKELVIPFYYEFLATLDDNVKYVKTLDEHGNRIAKELIVKEIANLI